MAEQLVRILSEPGIKRDGTQLEGANYVDAKWCRFQRGLPRKIGGYRSIVKTLPSLPRTLHAFTQDLNTYIHAGAADRVSRFYLDSSGASSVISDRTPVALTADARNLWQFDAMTSTGGTTTLIAQVAPNLDCICNSLNGQLFYGDLFATSLLTPISLPVGANATGGVVVLHPYLFYYGTDGLVGWSVAGDPTDLTSAGSGAIYPASQKIIKGLPLRGGPGNSPSGLFWSADSVFRVAFVGGSAIFASDVLATQTSIMSSSCVVDYDGVFYWLASDRIMMFNGVVRDVPNPLNYNWFFDNINYQYRQKIFATKVPRFGEIWWCAPLFGATEPSHAIIYNVRENSWYDTVLPNGGRSASIFPSIYRRPIMAGVEASPAGYKVWTHEIGYDEIDGLSQQPIESYFETSEIAMPVLTGENSAFQCLRVEPDFVQQGDMTMQIRGRRNARAPEMDGDERTFPATATGPENQLIYPKEQRRLLRFKFKSNTLGGHYEMGHTLAQLQPGDGRAT